MPKTINKREVFAMKKILAFLAAAVFVFGLGIVTQAQDTRTGEREARAEDRNLNPSGTFKDQDLIALKVEDPQGEDLGRIGSLAIDLSNGRVAFSVVEDGGFWGYRIGSKYVAVPLTAMSLKMDKNGKPDKFVLDMSKKEFSKAPNFSGNGLPNRRQAEESYRFFGQAPY